VLRRGSVKLLEIFFQVYLGHPGNFLNPGGSMATLL
jgi:hypothetical protein